MLIIPAIDLKDGACVRLRQGLMDDATVFSDDPVAMAAKWVAAGCRRLHLVDLNGAFEGQPVNGEVVTAIAQRYPQLPIQIGGGIRSLETIEHYLRAGVSYVIIGTQAVKRPEFVSEACRAFPGKIIVGLDAKNGFVATDGWAEVSSLQVIDLAKRFEADGVAAIVYTDIAKDGMMQGCNLEATAALARATRIPVIASGGIHNLSDIQKLLEAREPSIIGAITGRAIYEGSLDLAQAQALCDSFADCSSIEQVRERIDALDQRIVQLIAERGRYVRQAARFKKDQDAVRAPQRVEQVIAKVTALARTADASVEVVEQVYRAMINAFIELELAEHATLNPSS